MEIARALLVIVAVAMATWGGARAQSTLTCATTLLTCADYLNSSATPPDTCCSPLRTAVKDQLTCLCQLLEDKTLLQAYNVTTDGAFRVATSCGITQLNLCSAPASQASPVTPPPPGSSGKNAASRSKWIGMSGLTSLLLVWCSIVMA